MARMSALPIALLLALGAVLGLASCGGSGDANLLPGTTANQINANLDQVRSYVAEGECVSAEDAVAAVTDEVDSLSGVDSKLKAALKEGAARLSEVVATCEEEGEEEAEPSVDSAVESQELEAEERKQQKRLERESRAEEKPEGEGDEGGSQEEGPALPPQANGKGEEKGKGGGPPPATPAPSESGSSGGIGPGEQAGEG